jgi:hypothetical protein
MSSDLRNATAGAAGTALATSLLYPLNFTVNRSNKGYDEDGVKYNSALEVIPRAVKRDGVMAVFGGMNFTLQYTTLGMFSFFYLFNFVQRNYKNFLVKTGSAANIKDARVSIGMSLLMGYIAAAINIACVTPFEVCMSRASTGGKSDRQYKTVFGAAFQLLRKEGLSSAYGGISGLLANLTLATNPAIEYACVEQVKGLVLRRLHTQALTSPQAFCTGGFAKSLATMITFPYIRAKVILQTTKDPEVRKKSALRVIWHILREDGITGLYMGIGVKLITGILKSAILLATKEKVDQLILHGGISKLIAYLRVALVGGPRSIS